MDYQNEPMGNPRACPYQLSAGRVRCAPWPACGLGKRILVGELWYGRACDRSKLWPALHATSSLQLVIVYYGELRVSR